MSQVDIDGGLHKATMLADTLTRTPGEAPPQHPEVFDPTTVLPSLRSGGFSLIADARALVTARHVPAVTNVQSGTREDQPQTRPLCAEDLVRDPPRCLGQRDEELALAASQKRVVRHRRKRNRGQRRRRRGFFQVAATQEAPKRRARETRRPVPSRSAGRWDGWSLSAEIPASISHGPATRQPVPRPANSGPRERADHAIQDDEQVRTWSGTAYPVFGSVPGTDSAFALSIWRQRIDSLAIKRRRYSRPIEVCLGRSLVPYLRFEPIASPFLVLRDPRGIHREGSSRRRIVIRTFNANPSSMVRPRISPLPIVTSPDRGAASRWGSAMGCLMTRTDD